MRAGIKHQQASNEALLLLYGFQLWPVQSETRSHFLDNEQFNRRDHRVSPRIGHRAFVLSSVVSAVINSLPYALKKSGHALGLTYRPD